MTTTLEDIRFLVERGMPEQLENEWLIHQANVAQTELFQRIFLPGSTTLAINKTSLSYALSPNIREIRRLRLQSDLDRGINRAITPVYTLYNSNFEVPVPFSNADTLLIDYYAFLKKFTLITDPIDLDDRFKTLYTSYIQAQYYLLPSTVAAMPGRSARYVPWLLAFEQHNNIYQMMKKQVTDYYTTAIGTQKPAESGW